MTPVSLSEVGISASKGSLSGWECWIDKNYLEGVSRVNITVDSEAFTDSEVRQLKDSQEEVEKWKTFVQLETETNIEVLRKRIEECVQRLKKVTNRDTRLIITSRLDAYRDMLKELYYQDA